MKQVRALLPVAAVLVAWERGHTPMLTYEAGTWGPAEADTMIAGDGGWKKS